jgi:hypothetical protein
MTAHGNWFNNNTDFEKNRQKRPQLCNGESKGYQGPPRRRQAAAIEAFDNQTSN